MSKYTYESEFHYTLLPDGRNKYHEFFNYLTGNPVSNTYRNIKNTALNVTNTVISPSAPKRKLLPDELIIPISIYLILVDIKELYQVNGAKLIVYDQPLHRLRDQYMDGGPGIQFSKTDEFSKLKYIILKVFGKILEKKINVNIINDIKNYENIVENIVDNIVNEIVLGEKVSENIKDNLNTITKAIFDEKYRLEVTNKDINKNKSDVRMENLKNYSNESNNSNTIGNILSTFGNIGMSAAINVGRILGGKTRKRRVGKKNRKNKSSKKKKMKRKSRKQRKKQ